MIDRTPTEISHVKGSEESCHFRQYNMLSQESQESFHCDMADSRGAQGTEPAAFRVLAPCLCLSGPACLENGALMYQPLSLAANVPEVMGVAH